jgi:predicted DNA-binding protein (MmcQ/YjbR family)
MPRDLKAFESGVRKHALSFPEAHEDHPWGETAFKVRGKVFVFLGSDAKELTMSVKLPQSRDFALELPFAEPTGYGLGKHGWVTLTTTGRRGPPLDLARDWISESYRAVAPRKLVAELSSNRSASTAAPGRRLTRSRRG